MINRNELNENRNYKISKIIFAIQLIINSIIITMKISIVNIIVIIIIIAIKNKLITVETVQNN